MTQIPYYRPATLPWSDDDMVSPHAVTFDFDEIVDSGFYTKGNLSAKLALAVAERTHYRYGIPLGSGTAAQFILAKWYQKQGYRKIRVPAFTWPSTYLPFQWLGYQVRFVDIDRKTWLADFGDFKNDTNEMDVPVDTFGNVAGIPGRINIIDSAQSLGADWSNEYMRDRIISLSGSKILTSGEGGILLTQDDELANFAWSQGWFSRMPELSATLGLAYLEQFDTILEKKKAIAEAYHEALPDIQWQEIPYSTNHYIVAGLVDSPKAFAKANPDWEFRFYYQSIVNEDDNVVTFEDSSMLHLPNTEYVSRRIVAMPAWPDMPIERIRELRMP